MGTALRNTMIIEAILYVALLLSGVCAIPLHAAPFRVFEGHDEYVYMIAFANNGRSMVTASGDNTAILWDTRQRSAIHILRHDAAVYAAAVSPEGQLIATGSGDGRVALWNSGDGSCIESIREHGDAVYCVAFSPDGTRLASAGGSTDGGDTVC